MDILRNKKIIRLILVSVFAVLFLILAGYFTNKYFGVFKQNVNVGNPLAPKAQSAGGSLSIPSQIITSPATRFTIDIGPKQIESVTARLKFKPGPTEIKLGIRGDTKEPYLYEPLYHQFLQDVSWNSTEQFGETLYQKTKTYDSISALIKDPPNYQNIASYYVNTSVFMQKLLSGGFVQTNLKSINQKTGLRGTHTFFVRVDKAPFTFKLTKQDLNTVAGEDTYVVSIYQGIKLLEEKTIQDDGFAGTEKLKQEPQSVEFKLDSVKPGTYKIVATNKASDSLITALETNQSKLVIENYVYAFSTSPITLFTTYSPVTLTAVNKDFTQTVKLNDNISLDLKTAGQKYVFDLDKLNPGKKLLDLNALEIPKTNVTLKIVGYIGLSKDQYFDPNIINTTDLAKISSLDEVNYLLTPVKKAKVEGSWLVSEITIDASSIKRDDTNKLYVSLEIPKPATGSAKLEIESFNLSINIPGILTGKPGKDDTEKLSLILKISAIPKKIGSFFTTIYQSIFHKKTPTPTPSPTPPAKTNTPKPTVKASPSPTAKSNKSVKIKVLNGGAPTGYAQKYADLIKNAGYLNVEIGNAPGSSISGALIVYPSKSGQDAIIIENVLKPEYKTIYKVVDDKKTDITVTIGTK